MNDVDPQAWLADVLARLPDHPAKKIAETPQNTLPQTICAASGMSNFLFTPTFRIVASCVSCPCEEAVADFLNPATAFCYIRKSF
jgi:hypothetical protein